jgi:predicted DNA binding CopG/RHH family protein
MKFKLDNYEKELEKNADKSRPLTQAERKRLEAALGNSRKNRNVNIRISEHDLYGLRRKASEEGVPYQTLISSILHKFVNNRYVEEDQIMKTVRLLYRGKK